jgi:hypothetical protein
MGQAGVTIGTRIDRLPITSGHALAPAARGVPEPCTADPRSLLRPPYARRTVMMALFHPLQAVVYYGFGTLGHWPRPRDVAVLGPRTTGRPLDTVDGGTPAGPGSGVAGDVRSDDRASP